MYHRGFSLFSFQVTLRPPSGGLSNSLGLPSTSSSLCLSPPGFHPSERCGSGLRMGPAPKQGRRPTLKMLEEKETRN